MYKEEVKADNIQIKTFLRNLNLLKVPQEKNNKALTKAITTEDINQQIQGLKRGKSQ